MINVIDRRIDVWMLSAHPFSDRNREGIVIQTPVAQEIFTREPNGLSAGHRSPGTHQSSRSRSAMHLSRA
jgi:hypothetical protein